MSSLKTPPTFTSRISSSVTSSHSIMCNLETEGTKFVCGHYQITRQLRKIDCGNRYCRHSMKHPQTCPGCSCQIFLGPDKSETVTSINQGYCDQCLPWYGSISGGRHR